MFYDSPEDDPLVSDACWELMMRIFQSPELLEVVEEMKDCGNEIDPSFSIQKHPNFTESMMNGANSALHHGGVPFKFERAYKDLPWSKQSIHFVRVGHLKPAKVSK